LPLSITNNDVLDNAWPMIKWLLLSLFS